ncbi:MAG: glycosyltransferase, partial [Actinomycetia bacterium]|nr:glycosyltransferase [Actinomycetes bacterium]
MTSSRCYGTKGSPQASFVVPTFNSARTIDACLASIVAQRDARVELIVVDNHSTDGTVELAQSWTPSVETFGPERCAQRNHGARVAAGDTIIFVDSDMVLEPNVAREALEVLDQDQALGSLVIPERAFGSGPWIGARRLEKDSYVGDASVEAARVFRRAAFDQVGGYDEALLAAEDWDLADRVVGTGWSTSRVTSVAWHDEGRISLGVMFAKKRYYGATYGAYRRRRQQGRSIGVGR